MVDSIHLNYIPTLGFNKINPNYFLCPEHLTFKLFKLLTKKKYKNEVINMNSILNNIYGDIIQTETGFDDIIDIDIEV